MNMQTHEVAIRITKELKIKPRVRAAHLTEYAKRLNVSGNYESSNGAYHYNWTENEYKQLLKVFEA